MPDLLVSRVQVASLLQRIGTTWPMSRDARVAHLVFVEPIDVHERNPLVGVSLADLSPGHGFGRLRRRQRLRFTHASSLRNSAASGKFLDDLPSRDAASS